MDLVVGGKQCRHVAKDQERHKEHTREARHIHALRNLAYRYPRVCMVRMMITYCALCREPKKRCMWLTIWVKELEAEEDKNPWALAFDETEEWQLLGEET